MSVIGIDFGYQTCFIAVARQGGIETIANEYSDRCTPAVVSLQERQRSMGAAAKQQVISNLKNTVWGWKKLISRPINDPQVLKEKGMMPYEIVDDGNGMTGIRVYYLGEQQIFTPQQLTAMMLTKLKHTVEIALKIKVVDCVLSVPCYFTDVERRSMLDAAQMANLNVLRLMNDTTATALAYGIYKQDLPAPEEKPRVVVFLDFGHNDLQMSAVAFNKGKLKVLTTAADPNLGGRDIDMLLANHFTEDFKKRYKIDARSNPKAFVRLLTECEKLKKLMSANATDIPLNIECFMEDKDVTGKLKRAVMEELSEDLFSRTMQTMNNIMQSANLKPDDIYSVEIVGGSSRIPAIKNLVKEVYGLEPSTTLNADEAVARGCALQCAILSPTFRVRDFSIVDVQPYAIILNWQGAMEEDENSNLEVFCENHQVPFSKMLTFYRREPFTLEAAYSGSNIPFSSRNIGSFVVDKVVPQASGESSKVKVKVRVNIHGVFNVSSASMVEKSDEAEEEEMITENGPKEPEKQENGEEPAKNEETPTGADGDKKEEAMETDQTEESKNGEKKEEKKDKEEKKTKKKKVKVIDLPVTANVAEMSKSELNRYVEKEGQMVMQDKLEKERADAKNAVEEYVYEMRDKIYSQLEQYVKESERDALSLKLEDTENWLYDEGEDQSKQVYIDKLADLKKLGQPIIERFKEAQGRNQCFEELGSAIQQVQKILELYNAKDEKYNHLEEKEVKKVEKCLKEKMAWFDKNLNLCTSHKLQDDPPVLCANIRQERDNLTTTCMPILNKAKPKPKEEPPKDDKKKDDKKKDDKKNGQKTEENAASSEQAPEQESKDPSQEESLPQAESPTNMDLD